MEKKRGAKERHKLNKEIGARCKQARLAAGLTQEKFAEKINVSTQFISDMERGTVGLSLLTLVDLSNILSVTTDFILKGVDSQNANCTVHGVEIASLSDKERHLLNQNINLLLQAFHIND